MFDFTRPQLAFALGFGRSMLDVGRFFNPTMKFSIAALLLAAAIANAEDFKLIDGTEYKNVRISRVEPDGVVLITNSGIVKLYFTELPKEIQERYHYDTQKAAAFSAAQTEQQRTLQDTLRKTKEEQARKQNEYWRAHPGNSDPYDQGGSLYRRMKIAGEVVDKLKNGALVVLAGDESSDHQSAAGVVYLRGHPNNRMIVPGDRVEIYGTAVGTIEYRPPADVSDRYSKFLGPLRNGGVTIRAYDFSQ